MKLGLKKISKGWASKKQEFNKKKKCLKNLEPTQVNVTNPLSE